MAKKIVIRPKSVCPLGRAKTKQELISKRRIESAKALEDAYQKKFSIDSINKIYESLTDSA